MRFLSYVCLTLVACNEVLVVICNRSAIDGLLFLTYSELFVSMNGIRYFRSISLVAILASDDCVSRTILLF